MMMIYIHYQIHGRSRLQRYNKLANWEYVLEAARAQDPEYARLPVIGNGDIFSYEDWHGHFSMIQDRLRESDPEAIGLCSCAMIGRGVLIKPWLPQELKESRHIDISASERLDMLQRFV
jgi:tRNA-dihydrouridine synthase 3